MEEKLEKFERFLKNKEQFLKDMLSIVHDELIAEKLEVQLALIRDIIHHYHYFVKEDSVIEK